MNIIKNLKEIRVFHKVNQEEMAEILGINVSNYSRIETGFRKLTVDEIVKIANYLHEDVTYFFTYPERYVSENSPRLNCKNCDEKDKTIKTLNEYIEVLKKEK